MYNVLCGKCIDILKRLVAIECMTQKKKQNANQKLKNQSIKLKV